MQRRIPKPQSFLAYGSIAVVVVLTAIALWRTGGGAPTPRHQLVTRQPEGVMGTSCMLGAVIALDADPAIAEAALDLAEARLRRLEGLMSTWLDDSEISRLNRAPAGEDVALSLESRSVLHVARAALDATGKAFDITCGPLVQRWRDAARTGRVPRKEDILADRVRSQWSLVEFTAQGVRKLSDHVRVDIDGIAKGYAVDQALDVLRREGMLGGIVDVGGDLACFGTSPSGETWPVDVMMPFDGVTLPALALAAGGVCTSGNYARYVEIGGERLSHILDPRRGIPADAVPSVTVVAETAMKADIWATALSVLGEPGLERLPGGVEAMLVIGTPDDHRVLMSSGFQRFVSGGADGL